MEDLPAGRRGARSALRGGLLLGVLYFGLLLYWIPVALLGVTALAVPAYLVSVCLLAALSGGVGWALHRLRRGAGAPLWLALPLAWTAGEWLRAHLPGGLAFPWLGLGTSLTGFPELVGVAELVGARGVTFWIVLVTGLVAGAVVRLRDGLPAGRVAVAAALVVAVPAGWGVWRAGALEMRPAARVALIQPDIAEEVKRDPPRAVDSTRSVVERLTRGRRASGRVDLVALPETALPVRLLEPEGEDARTFVEGLSRRWRAPVLVGAYGGTGPGDPAGRHNSAFLVGPGGIVEHAYHKRFLVPLVERTPLLAPGALLDAHALGGVRPGEAWPVGRLESGSGFGVLICYESAFPEAARAYRRRGADFLVNLTNDAWFGRQPFHARTTALYQHPAHLVMRAVENRIGVARAANSGISMLVDPAGRVHRATSLFEPRLETGTVLTSDVRTLFSRAGDVVGATAVAVTLLLLVVARTRRRPRWTGGH